MPPGCCSIRPNGEPRADAFAKRLSTVMACALGVSGGQDRAFASFLDDNRAGVGHRGPDVEIRRTDIELERLAAPGPERA
ncbi:MAG TPA: hypothetical protein VJN41_01295, partial [Alphaproteobacteria bacterium]|nr:hypothetical protein [Alphaproteobacteria bacterium]